MWRPCSACDLWKLAICVINLNPWSRLSIGICLYLRARGARLIRLSLPKVTKFMSSEILGHKIANISIIVIFSNSYGLRASSGENARRPLRCLGVWACIFHVTQEAAYAQVAVVAFRRNSKRFIEWIEIGHRFRAVVSPSSAVASVQARAISYMGDCHSAHTR